MDTDERPKKVFIGLHLRVSAAGADFSAAC
jgi:hypothetical protein